MGLTGGGGKKIQIAQRGKGGGGEIQIQVREDVWGVVEMGDKRPEKGGFGL